MLEMSRESTSSSGNTKNEEEVREIYKKQELQYIYLCFTLDKNKIEIEEMELLFIILRHESEWFIIQEETGESGYQHYQGTLKLKKRKRLSELKKIHKVIHWEGTKQISASAAYCSRISKRSGMIWTHKFDIPDILQFHIGLYGWQLEVLDIINSTPDSRTIHWYWEPDGNMGKTTLAKYLVIKHNALMLTGKNNDMFHMIAKNPSKRKLFIVDVPRSATGHINYGAIELIKNGLVFSGKYEGCQLVFDNPHVFVFANIPPNLRELSVDRWKITRLQPQPDYKT